MLPHYDRPGFDHVYQNYTLRSKQGSAFSDHMKENGVEVLTQFRKPYYKHEALRLQDRGFPVTEALEPRGLLAADERGNQRRRGRSGDRRGESLLRTLNSDNGPRVYGLAVKRLLDIIASALGLLVLSPVLGFFALAIWLQDFRSPLYVAPRVGRGGKTFRMVKLRSMTAGADRSGVDSTSADDRRITAVGRALRAYKLDELSQLWNVLAGDMSLVGPRPNVPREVALYTTEEEGLLTARPGITDLASIVFSDEGDILAGRPDPDLAYHQLIRPWKSRLGLVYVQRQSMRLDAELIVLTLVAVLSRPLALAGVQRILARIGAPEAVTRVALRQAPLTPHAPPGSDFVVNSR